MPTYEYECSECGHRLEILQSITGKKLRKCPCCGKFKLNRLIGTGAGIIFKGSGFYETDYKRKAPPSTESVTKEDHKALKESVKSKPPAQSEKTKTTVKETKT